MAVDFCLQAALEYASFGWHVVPLKDGRSKHPDLSEWQNLATTDEDRIAEFWAAVPHRNVGVALGEHSGIVDIECDDDEAEQTLLRLFGGEFPVTPTFEARRGKHRLMRWTANLPEPDKNHFKIGALEFRTGNGGKGAQSVFPPSTHPSGAKYRWLIPPSITDVAEISGDVIARIWAEYSEGAPVNGDARPKEFWDQVFQGTGEGGRNDNITSFIGYALRNATDIESPGALHLLYETMRAVNDRNSPPLPEKELRAAFGSILKREQNRRVTEEADKWMRKPPEDAIAEAAGDKQPEAGMRVVIVRSEPPVFELHASQFSRARGGCIYLTAEQMASGRAIRTEALKQAEYPLPASFVKTWQGDGGLLERLVLNAETKEAPKEQKRTVVIAERLLEKFEKARPLESGATPNRKQIHRLTDGSLVFLFNPVLEDLKFSVDDIGRNELSQLLHRVGMVTKQIGGTNFKNLPREGFQELREMASDAPTATLTSGEKNKKKRKSCGVAVDFDASA